MTKEKITRLTTKIRKILDEECDGTDYEYGDGLIFAYHLRVKGTDEVMTDMATVGYPIGIANALTYSRRNVMKLTLELLEDPVRHALELIKVQTEINEELKKGNFSDN